MLTPCPFAIDGDVQNNTTASLFTAGSLDNTYVEGHHRTTAPINPLSGQFKGQRMPQPLFISRCVFPSPIYSALMVGKCFSALHGESVIVE